MTVTDEMMNTLLRELSVISVDTAAKVAILTAAYPLIRAQVLEEAAKAIDRRYMGDNNREDAEAKRCAEAIRDMKEDV